MLIYSELMVDIEFSHYIYRSAGVKPTKISGVTTKRECQPPTMTDFTNAKKKKKNSFQAPHTETCFNIRWGFGKSHTVINIDKPNGKESPKSPHMLVQTIPQMPGLVLGFHIRHH